MTSNTYMRTIIFAALCLSALVGITVSAQNTSPMSATVGQSAPNFTLQGGDGKSHALTDYKGKFVVLEWTNPNCPFVHKFYDGGAMQKFQKDETAKGVVWLRINSSAQGGEDYQTASDIASYEKENHVASTETLMDPSGKVGHIYGAT